VYHEVNSARLNNDKLLQKVLQSTKETFDKLNSNNNTNNNKGNKTTKESSLNTHNNLNLNLQNSTVKDNNTNTNISSSNNRTKSGLRLRLNVNKSQKIINTSKEATSHRGGSAGVGINTNTGGLNANASINLASSNNNNNTGNNLGVSKNLINTTNINSPKAGFDHFYSSSFTSPKGYMKDQSTPLSKNFHPSSAGIKAKKRTSSIAQKNLSNLRGRNVGSTGGNFNLTTGGNLTMNTEYTNFNSHHGNHKKSSGNKSLGARQTSPRNNVLNLQNLTNVYDKTTLNHCQSQGPKTNLYSKKDKPSARGEKEKKDKKEDKREDKDKEETQYKGRFFLGDKIIDKSGMKTVKNGSNKQGAANTQRQTINSSKEHFLNISGANFTKNHNSGKLYNNTKSRLAKNISEGKH